MNHCELLTSEPAPGFQFGSPLIQMLTVLKLLFRYA